MDTFAHVAGVWAAPMVRPSDVEAALRILGTEASAPLDGLAPVRRAELVDRFVRNLRGLGVHPATELHRQLMAQVHATPEGDLQIPFNGPLSLVEIRNQLKLAMTAIGMGWDQLTRIQSSACGLVRWLQSSGEGAMVISVAGSRARCSIRSAAAPDADASLVEKSPMVAALREQVRDFAVRRDGKEMRIEFAIAA